MKLGVATGLLALFKGFVTEYREWAEHHVGAENIDVLEVQRGRALVGATVELADPGSGVSRRWPL